MSHFPARPPRRVLPGRVLWHPFGPALAAVWLLAGCASLGPGPSDVQAQTQRATAAGVAFDTPWQPQARPQELQNWWARWGDPELPGLIEQAQRASPTLAAARTRIAESRATRIAAAAALGPALDGAVSGSRAVNDPGTGARSSVQAVLQASWELDLFGASRASDQAATARLAGAQAQAHEAGVSVAAEVAQQVLGWRYCQKTLAVTKADAASRAEVSRLTSLRAAAGLDSPADAALARASAAQGQAEVVRQSAECDIALQSLAALTAESVATLRSRLGVQPAEPADGDLAIAAVLPAQLLAQRPDVYASVQTVWAAAAEVGVSQADERPRLSIAGNLGAGRSRSGGFADSGTVWSIGPLQLTLPIWDGGQRAARTDAARARYEEAVVNLAAQTRRAVNEVESALLNLQSTDHRLAQARVATQGYQASLDAALARQQAGLGSLFELEDARRTALAAQTALLALQQERSLAWISLYRAVGGGWVAPAQPA